MRVTSVHQLLAAVAYLDRPDTWHRASARRRRAEARTGIGLGVGLDLDLDPGPVATAVAQLARAWDAAVRAESDRTWAELVTPSERAGRVNAQAVVRRASQAQVDALCIGKGWSVQASWRDWYRRYGGAVPGTRTWSGRRGA